MVRLEGIKNNMKYIVYGSDIKCPKCGKKIKNNEGFVVRGKKIWHYTCYYEKRSKKNEQSSSNS